MIANQRFMNRRSFSEATMKYKYTMKVSYTELE
ncbi:hypothetical protein L21SP3_01673 [Sedimentisphaera cyanobacteriorum]|uniref:Uncharacterized protein n=1 Tax=Sedimentisphaera cyanobacteriorum TaxID=1940790 RepID=A0A1Q2HRF6_9BACT|nr:hypothetical protein L21SP3_01673 [Sedimentisphaera cyanobacteriorum]